MKFYCISDNIDTQIGMRLAGIEGSVVHELEEFKQHLDKITKDKKIGILLITEKIIRLCPELIYTLKLTRKYPLIVEIPDRHGTSKISEALAKYINDAIGIKI